MHLSQVHNINGDERKKYLKITKYDAIKYYNPMQEKLVMNSETSERKEQYTDSCIENQFKSVSVGCEKKDVNKETKFKDAKPLRKKKSIVKRKECKDKYNRMKAALCKVKEKKETRDKKKNNVYNKFIFINI